MMKDPNRLLEPSEGSIAFPVWPSLPQEDTTIQLIQPKVLQIVHAPQIMMSIRLYV